MLPRLGLLARIAGRRWSIETNFQHANGIAVRRHPTEWMFPNLDFTVHLHRQPRGPWTGLDTTVTFGPNGQGLTSTTLHDLNGPLGAAQQTLTVRPLH
ncbi:hypothetical protein ACL02S_02080 [Nocardia sp. 004]|uniref:hypothetical protein n=1 Tax=Nocardia sp. 004 TaxID=3385978 RepID=UPI0039A3BF0E